MVGRCAKLRSCDSDGLNAGKKDKTSNEEWGLIGGPFNDMLEAWQGVDWGNLKSDFNPNANFWNNAEKKDDIRYLVTIYSVMRFNPALMRHGTVSRVVLMLFRLDDGHDGRLAREWSLICTEGRLQSEPA